MDSNAQRAKELLVHYMRLVALKSGLSWGSENDAEVEDIVDAIIEAAAKEGARRALQALPPSVQE